MTNYDKRTIEIEAAKKSAKHERERKSRFHENIVSATEKARDLKGDTTIKAGVEAFCMNCQKVVKYSERKMIKVEPWVACVHCQ